LKYCENYQNVTQRHEVGTCCWKNGADRLARRRVATKSHYLRSAIKRGMPLEIHTTNHHCTVLQVPIRLCGDSSAYSQLQTVLYSYKMIREMLRRSSLHFQKTSTANLR
jgi:hypothetical protein